MEVTLGYLRKDFLERIVTRISSQDTTSEAEKAAAEETVYDTQLDEHIHQIERFAGDQHESPVAVQPKATDQLELLVQVDHCFAHRLLTVHMETGDLSIVIIGRSKIQPLQPLDHITDGATLEDLPQHMRHVEKQRLPKKYEWCPLIIGMPDDSLVITVGLDTRMGKLVRMVALGQDRVRGH